MSASETAKAPFLITTAISYPNGAPHIGHAYEVIASDAIARFELTHVGADCDDFACAIGNWNATANVGAAHALQHIEVTMI